MMLYDEEEVPEARFAYNISPMSVFVRSEKRPWYDFITKVLAIVGGTFSVVSEREKGRKEGKEAAWTRDKGGEDEGGPLRCSCLLYLGLSPVLLSRSCPCWAEDRPQSNVRCYDVTV